MQYCYEVFPNPASLVIHVSEQITSDIFISQLHDIEEESVRLLYSLLTATKGVIAVRLSPYKIHIDRGACFSHQTVGENVVATFRMWCESHFIDDCEEWIQQPTIRTDIRCKMCPACQAIQDAEMESLAKDLNRLDY